MPNEEKTARREVTSQLAQQCRARFQIEVDHYVSTENDVLLPGNRVFGLKQVDAMKVHPPAQLGFDAKHSGARSNSTLEILPQQPQRKHVPRVELVDSLFRLFNHPA